MRDEGIGFLIKHIYLIGKVCIACSVAFCYTDSLITYPTTQTHADVPKEVREKNRITESTLRMSVGIEDGEDLLDELAGVFHEIESR